MSSLCKVDIYVPAPFLSCLLEPDTEGDPPQQPSLLHGATARGSAEPGPWTGLAGGREGSHVSTVKPAPARQLFPCYVRQPGNAKGATWCSCWERRSERARRERERRGERMTTREGEREKQRTKGEVEGGAKAEGGGGGEKREAKERDKSIGQQKEREMEGDPIETRQRGVGSGM